jgi:hypothetical protein
MQCSINSDSTLENLTTNPTFVKIINDHFLKYDIDGSVGLDSIILEIFSLIIMYIKATDEMFYSQFQLYVPLHNYDSIEGIYPQNILDILETELGETDWHTFYTSYVGLFYRYIESPGEVNNNIIYPLKSSLSNSRQALYRLDSNIFNEFEIYFDGNAEINKRKKNVFRYFSCLLESQKYYDDCAKHLENANGIFYRQQAEIVEKKYSGLSNDISLQLFHLFKQKEQLTDDNNNDYSNNNDDDYDNNYSNKNDNNNDNNITNSDNHNNNNNNNIKIAHNNNNNNNNNDNNNDNNNNKLKKEWSFTVNIDRDLNYLDKFFVRSMTTIMESYKKKETNEAFSTITNNIKVYIEGFVQWSPLLLIENNSITDSSQFLNSLNGGIIICSSVKNKMDALDMNIWRFNSKEIELFLEDNNNQPNVKIFEIFAGLINMSSYIQNHGEIFSFSLQSMSDDLNSSLINYNGDLISLRLQYAKMIILPASDHLYLLLMHDKKNIVFVIGLDEQTEIVIQEREDMAKAKIKNLHNLAPYRSEFKEEMPLLFYHDVIVISKGFISGHFTYRNHNWIILLIMYSIGHQMMINTQFLSTILNAVEDKSDKDKAQDKESKKRKKVGSDKTDLFVDASSYLKSIFNWISSLTQEKGKEIVTLLLCYGEYNQDAENK